MHILSVHVGDGSTGERESGPAVVSSPVLHLEMELSIRE